MDYFSSLEAEKQSDYTESPCSTVGRNFDSFTSQIDTLSTLTSNILLENSTLRAENRTLERGLACSNERNKALAHELESLRAAPTLATRSVKILEDLAKKESGVVSWMKAVGSFSAVSTELDRSSSSDSESDNGALFEPIPQTLSTNKNLSALAIRETNALLFRSLRGVAPPSVQFSTEKASPCIVTLSNIPGGVSPINISSIIRGGKIESISISRDNETDTQIVAIHFSSHLSAIEYTAWVNQTNPPLYINSEIISAALRLGCPAAKTNASRVLLIETVPGNVSTYPQFEKWVLLSTGAKNPGVHDAIQEIRFWKSGSLNDKLQGGVIFQSVSTSIRMMEAWSAAAYGLKIQYGSDACEGELKSTRREWIFA